MKNHPTRSRSLYLKKLYVAFTLIFIMVLFVSCNKKADDPSGTNTDTPSATTAATDTPDTKTSETPGSDTKAPDSQVSSEATDSPVSDEATARFEILRVDDDMLLVCGLENASGLYTVDHGAVLEDAEGQPMKIDDLHTGMIVDLTWNGTVQETYPAKFSYDKLKDTGNTGSDTITLYKRLIQALAEVDPGLNEGIKQSYFDFSKVDSLSDAEKEGLAYMCGSFFDVWGSLATREELAADGILDPEKGLEDSILVIIEEISVEGNTVICNAEKFRSGTGAYYFNDVTATYKDGEYTYEIKTEMIS